MNRKTITFLVASNGRGVSKKIVVPVAFVKAAIVLSIVGAVIFSASVVDYVGLLVESIHMKKLRVENENLKSQFQLVEGKVDALEKELERVRNFSTKLRLITNTDDPDRTLKLAIGPITPPSKSVEELNVPFEQRSPASELAKEDNVFLSHPPLDMHQGELANEESKDFASLSIRIDQAVKEANLREQGILELWENLSGRQNLLRSTPSIRPAKGWYTSRFGYRISPYTNRAVMHQGLDIAAAPGTPVYAPADGIITYAGYDTGYGKLVSVDHGYGVLTRFGHNSKIYVTVGQKIKRGDLISAVGNTGHSTGPHVHYEVRINNVPVDPANYIFDE